MKLTNVDKSLRDLQHGYSLKSGTDSFEKLADAALAEQGLPELVKKYAWDKDAKTADECATEAETRLCDFNIRTGTKANQSARNFDTRANGGNKLSPTALGARGLRACWTYGVNSHL